MRSPDWGGEGHGLRDEVQQIHAGEWTAFISPLRRIQLVQNQYVMGL
jgi:hypothetical protein